MKKLHVITLVLASWCTLTLWQFSAGAQSLSDTTSRSAVLDGPALKVGTDSIDMPSDRGLSPMPIFSSASLYQPFPALGLPSFETPLQRAFRVQNYTVGSVMPSVRANLSHSFKPIPYQYLPMLLIAGLFLTPQFSIPYGWYPMMSPSNPFVIAKTPGWAPEQQSIYSPDVIPQTVELEYDFATGTYKRKMVDWNVYEARMQSINPSNFNVAPIPRVPINDVERRIMNLGM